MNMSSLCGRTPMVRVSAELLVVGPVVMWVVRRTRGLVYRSLPMSLGVVRGPELIVLMVVRPMFGARLCT